MVSVFCAEYKFFFEQKLTPLTDVWQRSIICTHTHAYVCVSLNTVICYGFRIFLSFLFSISEKVKDAHLPTVLSLINQFFLNNFPNSIFSVFFFEAYNPRDFHSLWPYERSFVFIRTHALCLLMECINYYCINYVHVCIYIHITEMNSCLYVLLVWQICIINKTEWTLSTIYSIHFTSLSQ